MLLICSSYDSLGISLSECDNNEQFQKAAVRYIMGHMRMMRLEVHILTAAVILIMQ